MALNIENAILLVLAYLKAYLLELMDQVLEI
jgi:hypothetical protein